MTTAAVLTSREKRDVVVRDGRKWTTEISRHLPWCFWDALSKNDWRPDTAWARFLQGARIASQVWHVLEPLPINPSEWLKPHCCYMGTVIFYLHNSAIEVARCEHGHRTWPTISFVERDGLVYEVNGGRCVHVYGAWQMEWYAYKNTDLARHFNGTHDEACWPCKFLRPPAVLPSAADLDAVAGEERVREETA
jgi:hypothetical protein